MYLRGTVSGWNISAPGLVSVKFAPVVLVGGEVGEAVSRDDMFLILTLEHAATYEFGKQYDFAVPTVAVEDTPVE